jgi:CO/xanthine dehydrogenase FAD-binding subunit
VSPIASPRTLDEMVRCLNADPDLVPIAGCTDLMVGSTESRAELTRVIDLLGVAELRGIRSREGMLEIGSTTTFSEIRRDDSVRRDYPALAAAAAVVGGWQIQNRATLGGNMANASPAGDSLPALLALDAQVVLIGPRGERAIPYREFHTGYRATALGQGEVVGWVRLPMPPPGSRQYFRKVGTRLAQAISKVVVALVGRCEEGRIIDYRLAAGSVAATPVRLSAVEEAVIGRQCDPAAAEDAGRLAAASVEPIDDVRSTAEYRRFVLAGVVREATSSLGESN